MLFYQPLSPPIYLSVHIFLQLWLESPWRALGKRPALFFSIILSYLSTKKAMFPKIKLWHFWSQNTGFRFSGSHLGSLFILGYMPCTCVSKPISLMNMLARKTLDAISTFLTGWQSLSHPFSPRILNGLPSVRGSMQIMQFTSSIIGTIGPEKNEKTCSSNRIGT